MPLNPWAIVVAILVLLASCYGSYRYGRNVEETACRADAGDAAAQANATNAANSAAVDAIGADTAGRYAAAAHANRTAAHDAAERIRYVPVPADCRDVPADILQQHAATRARINASIRGSVRPAAAGPDPADAGDPP